MLSNVPNDVKSLAFLMQQQEASEAAFARTEAKMQESAAVMEAKLVEARLIADEASEARKAHEYEMRSTYGDDAIDAVLKVIEESKELQAQQDEREKHLTEFFAPTGDGGVQAADVGVSANNASVLVQENN